MLFKFIFIVIVVFLDNTTEIEKSLPNFNTREEYNKITTLRPRPTTPVTKPNIDYLNNFKEYMRSTAITSSDLHFNNVSSDTKNFIYNNTNDFLKNSQSAKIFVTIPSNVIQQCNFFLLF